LLYVLLHKFYASVYAGASALLILCNNSVNY